jgi:hypothetical protein
MGQPFDLTLGAGIDAGIKLNYLDTFAVGIAARDAFTPSMRTTYSSLGYFMNPSTGGSTSTANGLIPFDLSVGFAYTPYIAFLSPYITKIKFLLDYNDILDFVVQPDTASNPLLHIGAGVEITVLEILTVRGGFYQGLLNAGIALDLTYFKLSGTMYGRELSSQPGMHSVYNLLVSLEFRY